MSSRWVRTRRWVGLVLGSAALASAGCSPKGETRADASAAVEKTVPIRVGAIESRGVERVVDVVGSLKGWDEVVIGAKRAGRVARVLHDMGDRVKPGEPLLELETVDADLAVEQAQRRFDADLAKIGLRDMPKTTFDVSAVPSVVQAKVSLDRARTSLTRERSLMTKGAGRGEDLQNAENDERGAAAAHDNAVLTVQSAWASALASKVALDVARQTRVDLTMLAPRPSAPPKGLKSELVYAVTKRTVSEGQMVKEGEALFELTIENPLRLWCTVPEKHAGEVKLGQDVRIHVASTERRVFVGKVVRINPSVDPSSRTFQVEASFDNDEGRLRPGGFAKVEIVTNKNENTLTVPSEAVRRFEGTTSVFVIGDDGRSRQVLVETGQEGPGWIEAAGDLPKGGKVAVEGLNALANGTRTEIRPDPQAAEAAPPAAGPNESKTPRK